MGMRRRVSALETYIDRRVDERLERELEEMSARLEQELSHDEFVRVLEIVSREERYEP